MSDWLAARTDGPGSPGPSNPLYVQVPDRLIARQGHTAAELPLRMAAQRVSRWLPLRTRRPVRTQGTIAPDDRGAAARSVTSAGAPSPSLRSRPSRTHRRRSSCKALTARSDPLSTWRERNPDRSEDPLRAASTHAGDRPPERLFRRTRKRAARLDWRSRRGRHAHACTTSRQPLRQSSSRPSRRARARLWGGAAVAADGAPHCSAFMRERHSAGSQRCWHKPTANKGPLMPWNETGRVAAAGHCEGPEC